MRKYLYGFILLCSLAVDGPESRAEAREEVENPTVSLKSDTGEREANQKILVELFLASERKKEIEAIKSELQAHDIKRIRPQFFKLGNPPQNIAIGKNIPASVARAAIQLAITYNRGVKYLLPEFRFFPDHIVIGSSAFDEASQVPILPEDLDRLTDPTLSTEAFHRLYRSLTGEDKKRPTYID